MTLETRSFETGSVQQAVQRLAEVYPVDYVTLHLFRSGAEAQNKPYVRTTYPDAWVSYYLLNDYVRIDPVLHMAERVSEPFCWSQILPQPEQRAMMQKAVDYGVGKTGFSVRHVDGIGRRSVLSFNAHTAPGGSSWQAYVEAQRNELTSLAERMHRMALAEIYGGPDALPTLSPREIECLRWTAEGKAHTEIAIILGLSEHTVRGYLKDARMKLESVSLAQAVSKASTLGLI